MMPRADLTPAPGSAPAAQRAEPAPPAGAAGPAHWGSLHDAWQDAAAARTGAVPLAKEPLPMGVVIAIVEHRVHALRGLLDALDCRSGRHPRIGTVQPHARDAQGRNWNVGALDGGTSAQAGYEADFRRVVDALRDQFDLA